MLDTYFWHQISTDQKISNEAISILNITALYEQQVSARLLLQRYVTTTLDLHLSDFEKDRGTGRRDGEKDGWTGCYT